MSQDNSVLQPIESMKSGMITETKNPVLKRAIDSAFKVTKRKGAGKGTVIMFVYIDGDPDCDKVIFLS